MRSKGIPTLVHISETPTEAEAQAAGSEAESSGAEGAPKDPAKSFKKVRGGLERYHSLLGLTPATYMGHW